VFTATNQYARYVGTREAAERLGVTVDTVRHWAQKGVIPGVQPAGPRGFWLFRTDQLDNLQPEPR
jgi:excisionase family DNA binding protein